MRIKKKSSLGTAALGALSLMLLFSLVASPPQANADAAAAAADAHSDAPADPQDKGETEAPPPPVKVVKAKDIAKLLAKAKGKVLLLNFWATWCPPCVAEMPQFIEFFKKYNEKGVEFLSLSADGAPQIDSAVVPYRDKMELPFPVYVLDEPDPAALTEAITAEPSGALPETYLYNADGKIVKVWSEEIDLEMLEKEVLPLL
ncbi:MAG: redoxin family protein [Candidatus Hydrogenedens sp.]|nr:redoxin family protein [Candidatus Hydrogenedens sp.]